MTQQEEAVTSPYSSLIRRVIRKGKRKDEVSALIEARGAARTSVITRASVNPLPPPLVPAAGNHQEGLVECSEGEYASHSVHLDKPTNANQRQQHQQVETPEHPEGRLIREEIQKVMAEEYNQIGQHATCLHHPSRTSSPLAPEVLTHPVPHGFKPPKIEAYDGTSDPSEHVKHFTFMMQLCDAPDSLLCRTFPATLKGEARTWFHSLKDGDIKNFAELEQQFMDQFIASKRMVKDPSHLSGIRQEETETLRDFFRRFTSEARQIPGVTQDLLRGFLLGGLRPGKFHSALMRETIPSYTDLIRRIDKQIAADHAFEVHRQQFEKSSKRQREKETLPQQVRKYKGTRHSKRRPDQGPQPREGFTPLKATQTDIFLAIQDSGVLRRPEPLAPKRGNQSQYCDFHQGRGHGTEGCRTLKIEIERLIKEGLLRKFLLNPGASHSSLKARDNAALQTRQSKDL